MQISLQQNSLFGISHCLFVGKMTLFANFCQNYLHDSNFLLPFAAVFAEFCQTELFRNAKTPAAHRDINC